MDPINYSAMLTQPDFNPLMQGLQLRKQNRALDEQTKIQQQRIDLARQEAEAKTAKEVAWQADIGGYMANPTTQGIQDLFLKHPEQSTALKALADQQTGAQKTRNVNAAMRLGGFLNAGLNDQAVKDLEQRRAALAETGESTEVTDAALAAIKSGDLTKAKAIAGIVIGGTLGEDAGPVLDALGFSDKARRDAARDDRQERHQNESERHNRVMEGQGASRVGLSAAAGARAAAKGSGKGGSGGKPAKLPSGFILD